MLNTKALKTTKTKTTKKDSKTESLNVHNKISVYMLVFNNKDGKTCFKRVEQKNLDKMFEWVKSLGSKDIALHKFESSELDSLVMSK